MVDIAEDGKESSETMLAIDEGLEDVRHGRHRPIREVFAAVRMDVGLPARDRGR